MTTFTDDTKMKYSFCPFLSAIPERTKYSISLIKDNKAVIKACLGHYCGYVVFPKDDIPREWLKPKNDLFLAIYDNVEVAGEYPNVHGGLTYGQIEGNYVVYGFDCGHYWDVGKTYNVEQVMEWCEQMESEIKRLIKLKEEAEQ